MISELYGEWKVSELSGKLKVSERSFIRLAPSLSRRLPGAPPTSETIYRLRRLLYSPRQPVSQSACSKLTVRLPRHRPNANALRYGKWILDNKYLPQILPWVPSGEELNVLLWKNCPTLSAKNTHWDPICSLTIPKLNSNYLGQNTKPVVRPRWREYAYYNLGFEVNELMIRKLWNTYHHYKLGRP